MQTTPSGRFIRLPRKEYAALIEKAKAHDQYLAATKQMRKQQAGIIAAPPYSGTDPEYAAYSEGWDKGWLDCLREFGEAVVNAGMEDAPFE